MANPTVDKILGRLKPKKRQWYRRTLAAADPKLGWSEIPDCPMDTFEQLMKQRAHREPEKNVPGTEQRMLWFKHAGAFRNSPAMKLVHRRMGAFGTTAAYRLLEVMTERYGVDGDFSGSLILSPPFTERWLDVELFGEEPGPYDAGYDADRAKLSDVLSLFHEAGLIVFDSVIGPGSVRGPNGVFVRDPEPMTFLRITVPNMRAQADEYTARRANKPLVTPV